MKPNPLTILLALLALSFLGRAVNFAGAAAESLSAPVDKPAAAPGPAADVIANLEKAAAGRSQPADISAAGADQQTDKASAAIDPAPPPAEKVSEPESSTAEGAPSALLSEIRARFAALDRREAELADRARLLETLEKRIDEKTETLKAVKEELESRLAFADTAAKDDIARLAKMYENMKPKKAGEIFNAMDASFAAGFLTEMNNEAAALIMANMETNKAYAASVIIAGRNANINR
ncbi:MAG: MotE family protein [Parvularculaceae bacterium]